MPIYFRLIARHSRKCLDVELAGHANGTKVHQWENVGGDNQAWQLIHTDDTFYEIVAKHSGKCLDVAMGSTKNEAVVHQWDFINANNQKWQITPVDGVFCKLIAKHSDKCLEVGGANFRNNGASVHQLSYVGGDNQQWMLVPDVLGFSSCFKILSRSSRKPLSAASFQMYGKPASQSGSSNAFKWQIMPVEGSYFKIVSKSNGKCLDAGSTINGKVELRLSDDSGGDSRMWQVLPSGDVYYKIVSRNGRCSLQGLDDDITAAAEVSISVNPSDERSQWLLIPDLEGPLVRASGQEIYILESGHRILISDSETFDLFGFSPGDAKTISDDELDDIPLWPFIHESRNTQALVKLITKTATWISRAHSGHTTPPAIAEFFEGTKTALPELAGTVHYGVFLSHSNKDKPLARRIADDLMTAGIFVWLDEWQIKVGDSITHKIQTGLDSMSFVAVLLTRHSVSSGWVEKEWQSKIGAEAEQRKVIILPLKADDCPIPSLLRDKKYADFSGNYQDALNNVINAVKNRPSEINTQSKEKPMPLRFVSEGGTNTILFSISNASAGQPMVLSAIAVKAYQSEHLFGGIERKELAGLIENPGVVEGNLAALNISTGDFFVLAREVIRIEPGEILPFSLRLCCRSLDGPQCCRLILRFISQDGEFFLPSDCVYILKPADPYSDGAVGPSDLIRLLIAAAIPVSDLVASMKKEPEGNPVVSVHGSKYMIPKELLQQQYTIDDLYYTDVSRMWKNQTLFPSGWWTKGPM